MKRITCFSLALFLILFTALSAFASSSGVHWAEMRYVLFGQREMFGEGKTMTDRQILEQATQLVLDQYQGTCAYYLRNLSKHGVMDLPSSIELVDLYAESTDHRAYTHCGWDYPYQNDSMNPDWADVRWPLRKDILRAAVEYVFDFKEESSITDTEAGITTEKGEAFCRLLYCIHVLGDHQAYSSGSYYYHKGQILPMGGYPGETTIISELLDSFEILFPEQEYTEFVNELETIDLELQDMMENEDQWSYSNFYRYTDMAKGLFDVLAQYLPDMLQQEEFFSKVFPEEMIRMTTVYE